MSVTTNTKKKIASVATAAGVLAGGILGATVDDSGNSADVLLPPVQSEFVVSYPYGDDDPGITLDDEDALPEEEKKKRSVFSWYADQSLKKRLVISVVFLAAIWALGGIICLILAQSMNFVLAGVLGWIITASLLFLSYVSIRKAISPDTPIKKLLSIKSAAVCIIVPPAIFLIFKIIIAIIK